MRIAIVGSGIAGLGAALALQNKYDIRLFERNKKFGGHSNTHDVIVDNREFSVDTGFIVYNEVNYPNLTSLFRELSIPTKSSNMSFGFSSGDGEFEYSGSSLRALFATRKNLFNAKFLFGLRDILRFNKEAPLEMDMGKLNNLSLGDYLRVHKHGDWFIKNFILPMGGAIWSTPAINILEFPATNFISFFKNHGLLAGWSTAYNWKTVDGGSKVYVNEIINRLGKNVFTGYEVNSVERVENGVTVSFNDTSQNETFDHVILCCSAQDAARMIVCKTDREAEVLGCFKTEKNRAILHSDTRLMPKRRKTWSSWNFLTPGKAESLTKPSSVTYWMNKLQSIDESYPFFVTLNPILEPMPERKFVELEYLHPTFNQTSFDAQAAIETLQGDGGIWYAGAWLGYGFHEDGLTSGLRVAEALGSKPKWAINVPPLISKNSFLKAAE
ncbi:MAG: FAD-dependent oxidoreductase [Pseudomonadota bacterium]|nr:FAD-dependent oxidoreductase [Pseudomonadota bacterium]